MARFERSVVVAPQSVYLICRVSGFIVYPWLILVDEDMAVTELTAVEAPTVARPVSSRKRAENSMPYSTPESLPHYIYLPGQTKNERGHLVDGTLMLDQATSSITFETRSELIQPEMVLDVSSESRLSVFAQIA
jgi:hypothetical protein